MHAFPQTGFVRLTQIIGDKRKNPSTPHVGFTNPCESIFTHSQAKGVNR